MKQVTLHELGGFWFYQVPHIGTSARWIVLDRKLWPTMQEMFDL